MTKRLIKKSEVGDNTQQYLYPNGSSIEYDPESRTFTINQGGFGRTFYVPTHISLGTTPAEVSFSQSAPEMTYDEAKDLERRANAMGKGVRAWLPETTVTANRVTPLQIDQAYAELFLPGVISHPEKARDPNVTELFYKEHPEALTMTQKDYEEEEKKLKDRENELMGIAATTLVGGPAIGRGAKAVGRAIGESIVNPGSLVDRIALKVAPQIIKYDTPILGATTAPGMATNALVTSAFAGDVTRNIINGNLNWQTGLEAAFAATPFIGEGARLIPILYLRLPYNVKHPIKWAGKELTKGKRYRNIQLNIQTNIDNINETLSRENNEFGTNFERISENARQKIKETNDYYGSKIDRINELYEKLKNKYNVNDIHDIDTPFVDEHDHIIYISKDLKELLDLSREMGIINPSDVLVGNPGNNIMVKTLSGDVIDFTLTKPGESPTIPILNQQGQITGLLPVLVRVENGKPILSEGYVETTANNIKALEAKFPGAKAFGSSVGVSELGIPHYTHDIDLLITEGDAAKIPGLSEMKFNGNGFTKTVGIDKNGNIVSTHSPESVYEIDFNIIGLDYNGQAKGELAQQLFRHYFPEEYSEAVLNLTAIDSDRLEVDVPKTAKLLHEAVNPVIETLLNSHEIDITNKPKHRSRVLNYIRYSLNPDIIHDAINLLSRLINPNGNWTPPRFTFDNPEENAEILKEMGLSVDDATIHNPKTMLNLFDYWVLDLLTNKRGLYNPKGRSGSPDWNILSSEDVKKIIHESELKEGGIGLRANNWGVYSSQGGSPGVVGRGNRGNGESFDIMTTSTVKMNWDNVNTPHEAIQKVLYTTGSPDYEGDWSKIFFGKNTPFLWNTETELSLEDWTKITDEILKKHGVLAMTSPDMYRGGNLRLLMNNVINPSQYSYQKTPTLSIGTRIISLLKKYDTNSPIINEALRRNNILQPSSFFFPIRINSLNDRTIVARVPIFPFGENKIIDPLLKSLYERQKLLKKLRDEVKYINAMKYRYALNEKDVINTIKKEEERKIDKLRKPFHKRRHKLVNTKRKLENRLIKLESHNQKSKLQLKENIAKTVFSILSGGIPVTLIYNNRNYRSNKFFYVYTNDEFDKKYIDSGKYEKELNKEEKEIQKLKGNDIVKYYNTTGDLQSHKDIREHILNLKRKQLEHYKQTGEWKPITDFRRRETITTIERKRKGGKLIPRKFKSLKKPD